MEMGTTNEMRALLNAMLYSMRRKLLDKSWKMTEAFAEQAYSTKVFERDSGTHEVIVLGLGLAEVRRGSSALDHPAVEGAGPRLPGPRGTTA